MLSILQDRAIIRLRLPYEFIIIVLSVQIILRRVISIKAAIRKFGGKLFELIRIDEVPIGIEYNHRRGRIAQLVRAPLLHRGGRRFESCSAHNSILNRSPYRWSGFWVL